MSARGVQWVMGPSATMRVASKAGISQARTRLDWEVLRHLHDAVVRPITGRDTKGAWFADWRLVSLDGSPVLMQAILRSDGSKG